MKTILLTQIYENPNNRSLIIYITANLILISSYYLLVFFPRKIRKEKLYKKWKWHEQSQKLKSLWQIWDTLQGVSSLGV